MTKEQIASTVKLAIKAAKLRPKTIDIDDNFSQTHPAAERQFQFKMVTLSWDNPDMPALIPSEKLEELQRVLTEETAKLEGYEIGQFGASDYSFYYFIETKI